MLHQTNIIVHVIFGVIALIIGFTILILRKGTWLHVKIGRYYLYAMAAVVITGLIGVLIFKRNIFLLVVTIVSGYTAFSGVRALKLKGAKPQTIDYLVPAVAVLISFGYLYYLSQSSLYWSPSITVSILSALFIVTLYDLSRYFMTPETRKKLIIYEHVYKMVNSLSAITSAFTGTVLGNYKPYSQFLPGVLGFIYVMVYFVYLARKNNRVVTA
jgi:uncharacterized membrane protein